MALMLLGLLIFLGMHSLRIFAPGWREQQIAQWGAARWKLLFALLSIIGLVLICWGFGLARQHPVVLYVPPLALRHLDALFTLIAFVLFFSARVPRNHIKAKLGHPQVMAVKTWAFGHLLATGMLHDVVLFGAFLLWAVLLFIVSRRRDRAAGVTCPSGTLKGDMLSVVIGLFVWIVFALWLHRWLIGVNPLA